MGLDSGSVSLDLDSSLPRLFELKAQQGPFDKCPQTLLSDMMYAYIRIHVYGLNSLVHLTALFVLYNASKSHPKTLESQAGAPRGARARARDSISHLSAAVASESNENEGSYLWIPNPSLFHWIHKLSLSLTTSFVTASCFRFVSVQHR